MDISFATALVATAIFCADGGIGADHKCADGTPAVELQMDLLTASGCEMDWLKFDYEECGRHVSSIILEISRNGKVILTVPADVLSEKERGILFSQFFAPPPPK
jgi:hypothetical protein